MADDHPDGGRGHGDDGAGGHADGGQGSDGADNSHRSASREGSHGSADRDGPPQSLLAVVEDPVQGRQRLPYLLGKVESEDPRERLTAALAVCLVVEEHPDMLEYAVERLVDRLDDEAPIEVGHALDYLAARNPQAIDEVITDFEEEREVRARRRLYQSGGGFARSQNFLPTTGDRPVGRTRIAGGDGADDPRRVHTTEAGEEPDPLEEVGERDENGEGDEDDSDSEASDDSDETGGDDGRLADQPRITSGTLTLVTERLSAVIERSRFDDLDVLTERQRGRFGDVYRAAGHVDGDEYAVALSVFRLPEEGRRPFLRRYSAAMERWTAVADHDRLLTVYDWGVRPRPWAALAYTDLALEERERLDAREAVADALDLADGLAHAHQRGVVHGGLDPATVHYPGTALTAEERQRPRLSHPGLGMAYAGRAGVGEYLDPRYAPPEFYDDDVGSVDHATDVYALGLLLYRLCTGRPPYEGPLSSVREQVLASESPAPSAVDPGLPPALDRVVGKATATRKLKRYETVNALRRELRGVLDG